MEFSKVIGKVDPNLVKRAQEKLTAMFLDIGSRWDNKAVGTQLGGDPLVFSLVAPNQHICTMNMPTAATDGKFFYWNPEFVLKRSKKALRFIAAHEAWHAIYMHPSRIAGRHPRLWNICVDYIVNYNVIEDLNKRDRNGAEEFKKELGGYITVDELVDMIKNPQKHQDVLKDANSSNYNTKLPNPHKNVVLTPEQKQAIERRSEYKFKFYADPELKKEWQSPDRLYNYLISLLPKCPECGKLGHVNSKSGKDGDKQKGKGKGKDKSENGQGEGQGQGESQDQNSGGQDQCDDHSHGDGNEKCDHGGGCGTCGGNTGDILGIGDTLDDHMNSEEDPEKTAQKIYDAMQNAKKMAGHIPAALEDEIGRLTDPVISFKDYIRGQKTKAKNGNQKNDWSRFRTRPMFGGLMIPKKVNFTCKFACLLDTSGSMSREDMAFGISQLQSLDTENEGTIVPADCSIYWDDATKLRKCDVESLKNVKVKGRGGTMFADFFKEYEKKIGKCDFIVMITDGYLMDTDIAAMQDPGIPVIWLLTDSSNFKAPFGRVFDLKNC